MDQEADSHDWRASLCSSLKMIHYSINGIYLNTFYTNLCTRHSWSTWNSWLTFRTLKTEKEKSSATEQLF